MKLLQFKNSLLLLAIFSIAFFSCDQEEIPGESINTPQPIQTRSDAMEAFGKLMAIANAVNSEIDTGFEEPFQKNGLAGTVAVTGKKTIKRTSYSSSTSTFTNTDLAMNFNGYQSEESGPIVEGVLEFFNATSFQMRCSSTTCASSSGNSSALDAENIKITFQNEEGLWISDELFIDATSPSHTSSWTKLIIRSKSGYNSEEN